MTNKVILILTVVGLMLPTLHCGKRGPLKLHPELLPKPPENLKIFQVGDGIRLQWDFPRYLSGKDADKKSVETDTTKVTRIDVFYSEKEILGGKFRRKSKLRNKLTMKDLTRFEDPFMRLRMEQLTAAQRKKREKLTFYADIPFEIKNLTGKTHFIALRYLYGRKKSRISKVAFTVTHTPVKAVDNLTVTMENKLIRLEWNKPREDKLGAPIPNISGYAVYRKVIPKDPQETAVRQFERINRTKVLKEFYEDRDTGLDGDYHYYVTTIIAGDFLSAPSAPAALSVTDVYPPDVPVNLVVFRASDHMFLTWKPSPDKDLSHYRLYRKDGNRGAFTLTADNITVPQFKDQHIKKGVLYHYQVTAVDKRGNESGPTNKVKEEF